MNVYLIMRNAADVLTVARRARLGGDIVRAQRLESKAERILGQLKAAGSDLGDKLLTAWEEAWNHRLHSLRIGKAPTRWTICCNCQ